MKKVAQYISRLQLLAPEDRVLIALSGGADSVALLRILLEMGYRCEAAHCNFHLRGAEADRDEAFVSQLCHALQVPLHVTHFDTRKVAAKRRISIEMAARDLRYAWFEKLRQERAMSAIAVAHHQDDSAETFLLNLLRGAGIRGLQGIHPRNGHIVRPLLCLNRQEILDYLTRTGQPYITDSSNLEDHYMRNKIRLHLIPLLREINPQAVEAILKSADYLASAATLYQDSLTRYTADIVAECNEDNRMEPDDTESMRIDIAGLLNTPEPGTILFELLKEKGFNTAQVNDIMQSLSAQAGKVFETNEWRLLKDRTEVIVEKKKEKKKDAKVEAEEAEGIRKKKLFPGLTREEFAYSSDFTIPRDPHTACIDADKIHHDLSVRPCRPGDWFIPFGMKGRKKLSDFLTDRKLSRFDRERQQVLCAGEDIVWVIGQRMDNRFRIDPRTKRVLVLKMQNGG